MEFEHHRASILPEAALDSASETLPLRNESQPLRVGLIRGNPAVDYLLNSSNSHLLQVCLVAALTYVVFAFFSAKSTVPDGVLYPWYGLSPFRSF